MMRSLIATLLLLPLSAIAETGEKGRLEDVSSGSPDAMQKHVCLIGEEIKAKSTLERRFKSMGHIGAAGRFADERRSLQEKEQALLQQIRKENPEMSVPKC